MINITKQLMKSKPETTAIIAVNDILATGVMRALMEMGLRIPEDVSVVGTDNSWISRNWTPSLTTIDIKKEKMAELAVNILERRLKSKNWKNPIQESIDSDLIIRDSTCKPRSTT